MGSGTFNIAKCRIAGWAQRVIDGDPVNARFVVTLATGTASDVELEDYQDLQSLFADPKVSEATFGGYARKVVSSPTVAVDYANDRHTTSLPNQTWTAAAGEDLTRLYVCYDEDFTGGDDTAIVPMTFHDFIFTTNGTSVTASFAPYFARTV